MVVEDSVGLYSPRWSAHGEAIYYLRARDETRDLNKIKISAADGRAKGEPEILRTGLQAYGITLSRDNKKLSYTKHVAYANLWHVTRKGKGQAKKIETKKLTSGTFRSGSPRISPNGKKVAFTQQNNIFVMPIEGGQLEQLTFLKSDCSSPCWSPDGKELAFIYENKVWRVWSNGGTPGDFDNTKVSSFMHMTWAPGRNILYQRPGNQNFHFLDPKTGEERALVANDSVGWIFSPRYSPDGKEVAMYWNRYIANYSETPSVWLISLKDSSQTLLCKGLIVPIEWSADGKWIYGWNPIEKPIKLVRVPATGGSATTLVTLPFEEVKFIESIGISMTPDGRSIVCAVAETQSDVWLMENFDPDVK